MAASLDFSKFTFGVEQITDIKSLLWDELVNSPEINSLVTLFDGIVYKKEVGYIGEGSDVGVLDTGCGTNVAKPFAINTRVITWEPIPFNIFIQGCEKDLENTAAVYSVKTGVDRMDYRDSDYMAIVLEVLSKRVKSFIYRFVFFNSTTADTIANGGTVTNGTDLGLLTLNDGLFIQMLAQIAINPAQRVAISENAGATYVAQKITDATHVPAYLNDLYFGASLELQAASGQVFICTQSFYNAYKQSLTGFQLESLLANLTNGMKTLTFQGVPLIAVPEFDKLISTYFNTGAKLANPHRCIYTTKEALGFGVDSMNSFGDTKVYYNDDTEKVSIKQKGKADAKLMNPKMFMLAI